MKNSLGLLGIILVFLSFQNCKKDTEGCPDGWQEARIIGQDLRLCACCGGWFIEIEQDTVRTFVLPDGFDLGTMPDLPIEVCLQYETGTGGCQNFESLIEVTQIVKR